jgi:hypothetical protein
MRTTNSTHYLFLICLLFCSSPCVSAEIKYDTFALGFNPKGKTEIVRQMLTEKGKLVTLRTGTIFVRDEAHVLKAIKKLLDNPKLDRIQQVKISLRRRSQQQTKNLDHSIGGVITDRSISINGTLGQRSHSNRQNGITSISTVVGKSAFISITKNHRELLRYHRRFLPIPINVIDEAVILKITPWVSGTAIKAKIESIYRVKTEGQPWREYKTEEINTTVFLKSGRWQSVGGTSNNGQQRSQQSFGLSGQRQESTLQLDFDILAEL